MKQGFLRGSLTGLMVLAAVSLTGCLGIRSWEYPPDPPGTYLDVQATAPIDARVAVLPLKDERGHTIKEQYWLAAIPLVPYGEAVFDRPEEVSHPEEVDRVEFDPPRDFAKAVAKEIEHANVFSSVRYAETAPDDADLVIRGTLYASTWNRLFTTYMLGAPGGVLWFLGAPMGSTTTTVKMDLKLTPADGTTPTLWSFTMRFQDRHVDGPYYGIPETVETYPIAVQEALKLAIAHLVQTAENQPETLRPRRVTR